MRRFKGWFPTLFLLGVLIAVSLWWEDKSAPETRAVATEGRKVIVSDGDSFTLGGQRIRLYAIDAPEHGQICQDGSGQPYDCGQAARAALQAMLKRPGLGCASPASDRYGRTLAVCSVEGIEDIGKAQVAAGHAIALREYGQEPYAPDEDAAKAAKRGLWAGSFEEPWQWRERNPRPAAVN